jgi:hypothetical protein
MGPSGHHTNRLATEPVAIQAGMLVTISVDVLRFTKLER